MSGWNRTERFQPLPPGWHTKIRPRILRRDGYRCRWVDGDQRCPHTDRTGKTLEVDHIIPRADNGTHAPTNLQTLCILHHERKTIAERPTPPSRRRPPDAHPGMIDR